MALVHIESLGYYQSAIYYEKEGGQLLNVNFEAKLFIIIVSF